MVSTSKIVVVLTILLALSHVGTCLKCYHCSSTLNKNCDDPFNKDGIISPPCPPDQRECFKIKTENVLRRGCGNAAFCAITSYDECYSCDSNQCNSSSSMVPSFIVTSFAGIMFAKYIL